MKCVDIDALLCDYVDGTLGQAGRTQVDTHILGCADCAALLSDAQSAVQFMSGAGPIEAPPELVTRILYKTHFEAKAAGAAAPRGWFSRLFQPILQPRIAMGMAMTILSFSMIGRMAGIPQRPLTAADLEPANIVAAVDMRAHRAYDRLVKYVDNLRLVYEIQSRLSEWSAQEEQASAEQGRKNRRVEPAIPAVTPDEREKRK
jgi:anti-sigma factor RsiW